MFLHKFTFLLKYNIPLKINKRSKWNSANIKLFANLFGMDLKEFSKYRLKNKIRPLSAEEIRNTAALCEGLALPKKEWLKYPNLLKDHHLSVEQQYLQLKEGGFVNITAHVLAHYRKYTHQKISFLKLHSLIAENTNVAESFLSYLKPKPDEFPIDDLTDDSIFEHIHHTILTRYLMWRFDVPQDTIEKFYRVFAVNKAKSFNYLCQNFAIAEDIGYPPKKLLKYGYLLNICPKHPIRALSVMPTIAGADLRKAMKFYPKLIGIPLEHYVEIYDCLKKDVPDETIQKCMNIFSLSPKTVEFRIKEIKSIPSLKVMLNNPQILRLVVHYNQARSRLSFLKQLKLKCAPSRTLVSTKLDTFTSYIKEGRDVNSIKEVLLFIKRLLNIENGVLETNLKKHPFYRNVPLVEIEKSYKILKKLKFTNQSLLKVPQVLLYPRCKIDETCTKINQRLKLENREIDPVEQLNLILYLMEKEYHFTGDGIWNREEQTT